MRSFYPSPSRVFPRAVILMCMLLVVPAVLGGAVARPVDAQATDDAEADLVAASVEGDARGPLVAVSGTGTAGTPLVTSAAAGSYRTCAITEDGNVRCWGVGEDWDGQMDAPEVVYTGGDAIAVHTGESMACLVHADGGVSCASRGFQKTPWSRLPDIAGAIDVVLGETYDSFEVCVLTHAGHVRCVAGDDLRWGDPSTAESRLVATDAVTIAAGWEHYCWVTTTGDVGCFERFSWMPAFSYDGGDAVDVAGGHSFTCIVLTSGNVACDGVDSIGQTTGYNGGDAIAVGAGYSHACALLEGGDVTCWGNPDAGRTASYTGGDAVSVSAGDAHSCVLTSSGGVTCWGANQYGQSESFHPERTLLAVTATGKAYGTISLDAARTIEAATE